jgi:hypothetical protein
MAHGRRQWRCCFQWRRGRFFLFPCPPFLFLFVFSQFFFLFGLFSPFPSACSLLSSVLSSLLFFLSSLCSLSFGFIFFSPCFFHFFPFFLLLPFAAVLGAIYRANERGFLLWRMGSKSRGSWSTIGRDCQGAAPPVFWQAHGGWSASGRGWRGAAPSVLARCSKRKEEKASPFLHARLEEEERGTVSFKTTPF